ncbi:MAG: hypothetical protein A2Y94_10915 [Caldithrix sp. RBG_13_44_9]|nr:MAG: hypothetical protein A2Y94_10915 [Caldithrix sp. RBG_13_44_9]
MGCTNSYGTGGDVWLIKTATDPFGIREKDKINFISYYTLDQNSPNPFNPRTTFEFSIPNPDQVKISI